MTLLRREVTEQDDWSFSGFDVRDGKAQPIAIAALGGQTSPRVHNGGLDGSFEMSALVPLTTGSVHNFGFLAAAPSISQRTADETAAIVDALRRPH